MSNNWKCNNEPYLPLNIVFVGRLLTNNLLLPLLLGVKLNLASFLPILLGFLVILAKKSTILLKIALVLSSVFGGGGGGGGFLGQGGFGYPSTYGNPYYSQGLGYKNQPFDHYTDHASDHYHEYDPLQDYHKKDEMAPLPAPNLEPVKQTEDKFYDYEKNMLRKTKSLNTETYSTNFWQPVN